MKMVNLFPNMHTLKFFNMIIYMIQTLQVLMDTRGEEFAKSITECGQFKQLEDGTPYLVVLDEDKLNKLI